MVEPLVDVVMLVHSQHTWADLAIRAVEHHTRNPYRLILVDQDAPEASKRVLADAEKRGHTVVHLAENRSFSNGMNAGVRAGSAKYVILLNDDALACEGWDSALLQDVSDKAVGLAGARTNYAAGPSGDPAWKGDAPFLAFVCVALRREVWNTVGPLDEENFTGFSSEDLDYCWRVVKHGYKLRVSPKAYVLHAGSRSVLATVGSPDAYNAHNLKYNRVLEEKWGKDWIAGHTKLKQRVLVASYHAEEWTRVAFTGALANLRGGGYAFSFYQHTRTPIHLARQLVCDYATNNSFDVLIQLDDDATFPADLISRLLAHEKEVVVALAYQRKQPYLPCIYELATPTGINGVPLLGWERTGLRRVDASGFHCSLIRTSAIKKLREAGITEYWGGFEKCGEDFAFSANLRKVGIPLYCDTDLIAGHISSGFVIDESYKRLHSEGKAQ